MVHLLMLDCVETDQTTEYVTRVPDWSRQLGVEVDARHGLRVEQAARLLAEASVDGVVLLPGPSTADGALAHSVATARCPVVVTDHREVVRGTPVTAAATAVVSGRGPESVRWALRHLRARASWPVRTVRYGAEEEQVADLRLPDSSPPHPVVVLLHGGFWRRMWGRDLMDDLALDLVQRGYATWNVEYRRGGAAGSGVPATFADVRAAIPALSALAEADSLSSQLAVCGHSVGGQLALLAAAWGCVPADALVVSLAGVCDVRDVAERGLGEDAAVEFMGAPPSAAPADYAAASPIEHVPLGVRQVLVHGPADERVPIEQSRAYARAARAAGDTVELIEPAGADHFVVIDPSSTAWSETVDRLQAHVPV